MKKSVARQKPKVLIALSGGIDSAVSAYLLLKKGYRVEAAFMKNWTSQEGLLKNECPWLEDRREALRVAAFLGLPLHTLDFEKQYQNKVMKYFFSEYQKGRTPNPDVMCNKEIKFKLLYDWAMKNGFDYLATGHYARIAVSGKQTAVSKSKNRMGDAKSLQLKAYSLKRSADEFKDQTYFIYNIKQKQLSHLLFPIGGMKKAAVRVLARKIGLPNAERKESMGLCFVGKIRLKDFLGQKVKTKPGNIINQDGKVIGRHKGLETYTLGQRQGIMLSGGPYYVFKKDLKSRALYVTNDPDDPKLYIKVVVLSNPNWLTAISLERGRVLSLLGRYRHQGELEPLILSRVNKNRFLAEFKTPQKAVASGQSLVIYKGKECLGGGIID